MINREEIKLTEFHRGNKSNTFTGRPQGVEVRKVLGFDKLDSDGKFYKITIPANTISFNPSFFLGLFFPSIKKAKGYEGFEKKYLIESLEGNLKLKERVLDDIRECKRQAINEYNRKTGLSLL